MSVINKMLRDLDRRQGAGTNPVPLLAAGTGLAHGTLIVNDPDRAGRRRGSLRFAVVMVATLMVLASAAAGWWYLDQMGPPQRQAAQGRVAVTAPPLSSPSVVPVTAVAPAAAPAAPPTEREPVMVASAAPATVEAAPAAKQPAVLTLPVVPKLPLPVVQSDAAPADISLKMDSTFKGAAGLDMASRSQAAAMPRAAPERSPSGRATTAAATVPTPSTTIAAPTPPRQSPALEALAQAQSLWSAGSHAAAIDLLHEALAVAERAHLAGAPAGNPAVLASLARELARMELAEGRVSQALEMLKRLEPALSGVAEVWAIRGNAAQRLGRHPESAAAYLMALKLRPNEPRWMLGAAVSLAAQGQTAAAAELAEQARAGGALSPEVATYLRQLGVPLRER